jgi:hypothetical protein
VLRGKRQHDSDRKRFSSHCISDKDYGDEKGGWKLFWLTGNGSRVGATRLTKTVPAKATGTFCFADHRSHGARAK